MQDRRTVLLFSGQGSQYFQMGRELFEGDLHFRSRMLELDAFARPLLGGSVVEEIYGARGEAGTPFDQIAMTGAAIIMVELAVTEALRARGVIADMALGVSLGSYAAAVVCGCIRAEDALAAAIAMAQIIAERCQPGGMTAILADSSSLLDTSLLQGLEVAAINSKSHFVVSGLCAPLESLETRLTDRRITFQRLAVRYAFHSRWLDPAETACRDALTLLRPQPAAVPFVCCIEGQPLEHIDGRYFWRVARAPIRFAEAIAALERSGLHHYIDAGPSGSLAATLKYARPSSALRIDSILSPFAGDLRRLHTLSP